MAKREVLIVTGGMTPQVVTETVYVLARRAADPIVPSKIVCAVTGQVERRFGDELSDALARLQLELGVAADWGLRAHDWQHSREGLFVAVPHDEDSTVVQDIRSDREAVLFGDLMSRIVWYETQDVEARVHLSLAGGRKTMSFHGGAAMSLFGRPIDELSHVLVQPPDFEQCPDFWFPTAGRMPVMTRDGRRLDAAAARLEMGLIPFIRVRDWLPPGLRSHPVNYHSYVAQLNAVLHAGREAVPLFLELVTASCRVRIGDLADFTLPNTEFALYQLMAEWQRDGHAGADSRGMGDDHRGWLTERMFECPEIYAPNPVARFLDIYDDTFRSGTGRIEDLRSRLSSEPADDDQRSYNVKRLREWKSRLRDAIKDQLHHPDLAARFGAPLRPVKIKNNRVVFGLPLDPREIVIRAEEPLAAEPAPRSAGSPLAAPVATS